MKLIGTAYKLFMF